MADIIPVDLSRLQTTLMNSGLQIKDPPLYQVINQLIIYLQNINKQGGKAISNIIVKGNSKVINSIALPGEDGIDGFDGIPGINGINGVTGAQGPVGPVVLNEDGQDGFDGFNIPNPGPAGSTGAQGPIGVTFPVEDGLDGEDGFSIISPSSSATSDIHLARLTLVDDQIAGLHTTPTTIISGISSKTIIPLGMYIVAFKSSGAGWTNGNTTWGLIFQGAGNFITTSVNLALGNSGTIKTIEFLTANLGTTAAPAVGGKDIQINTAADITAGTGGTPTTVDIFVPYIIQDPSLY